jgi:basic membrane protein A and related proteins
MMLNKKVKLAVAFAALGLVAAACGSDSTTSSGATTPGATTPTAATTPTGATTAGGTAAPATTAPATGDCKGGPATILFDLKGRGDKSFNDSAAVGLDKAKAEFGYTVTENVRAGSDEAELFKKAADAKQELVIGVGFAFGESMSAAAKANSTIHYAIVDSNSTDANVSGLLFKANEGSYLVGAAAALKSTTGHIGFIGGVDVPLIHDFFVGYEAGAKSVKADIKIDKQYITPAGDFSGFGAPDKAKTIAAKMYQDGADVIYHAAGSSGDGLFSAAKEASAAGTKVWAIGVDSDQALTSTPDLAPFILTSMIKHVDVAVYETMKDHACGTFKGGDRIFSVKDGGLDYATTGGNLDDIKDKLDKIKADISSGAVVVPAGT